MGTQTTKVRRTLKTLEGLARVASAMVDGEEADRILTARAVEYSASPDPAKQWLGTGDFHDVDHVAFLRMKKLLMRLERLADFRCCASLWIRAKGLDRHVNLAVQNGTIHRYYEFRKPLIPIPPEMTECMETGKVVVAPEQHPTGTLTVLAPVFDSLGSVVGVVELSAAHPDSKVLTPAWS